MIRVLPLADALTMGPMAWDALALSRPFPSIFMSWAWHQAWWESASSEARAGTRVFTDFQPGSFASPTLILPLGTQRLPYHRLRIRGLGWSVGDLGTSDHLDLLATDGADVERVADKVREQHWDLFKLTNIVEPRGPTWALLEALKRRGCRVELVALWPTAQIELPPTWSEYLARTSEKRRYRLRKDERDLVSRHAVRFRSFSTADLDEGWSHLTRLHALRWEGGKLRSGRLATAYLHLARSLAAQDKPALHGLEVDGEIVAAEFCAEFGDTIFGIQSGRDPAWQKKSVGRVLRVMTLRRAIERGLRWFDFSRSVDAYKQEWCTSERWCYEARVYRNSVAGALIGSWGALAAASRPMRRANAASAALLP